MGPRPASLTDSSDTPRHRGEALGVRASGGPGCGGSRPPRVVSPGSQPPAEGSVGPRSRRPVGQGPRHTGFPQPRRATAARSPSAPPPTLPRGLPRTWCSFCRRDAGRGLITGWQGLPLPSACPAARRAGGCRLVTTRLPGSRLPWLPQPRPARLPRRALTYLSPRLRPCDAQALPLSLKG